MTTETTSDSGPYVNNFELQKLLFETQVKEASGLYDLLIKVSGAIFGGVLLFIDKLLPKRPSDWLLAILAIALCLLVTSILLTITVRRKNIESLKYSLYGEKTKAEEVELPNERRTNWAIGTLVAGMALILVLGVISFRQHALENKEGSMNSEIEKKAQHVNDSVNPSALLPNTGKIESIGEFSLNSSALLPQSGPTGTVNTVSQPQQITDPSNQTNQQQTGAPQIDNSSSSNNNGK